MKEYLKKMAAKVRIPAAIGILLWPTVAMADPGSALMLLGSFLVKVGFTYVGYALIASTIIYGTLDARRRARNAAENAKNEFNRNLQDRSQTVLTQLPPWTIRYGRTMAGSTVVAVFTTDKTGVRQTGETFTKKDAYKHIVYVHAAHECAGINAYRINGIEVGELDDDGWATNPVFRLSAEYGYSSVRTVEIAPSSSHVAASPVKVMKAYDKNSSNFSGGFPSSIAFYFGNIPDGTYTLSTDGKTITNPSATITLVVTYVYLSGSSTLRISSHLGSPTQTVDTYLNGLIPDKWTANHRLRGRCYSVVTIDLENTDFQGGIPQFETDLNGRLIYDPRSATTIYSTNWAVVIRDWLTSVWGADADVVDINDSSITTSANDSDVGIPVSVRGYTDTSLWSFASSTDGFTAINGTVSASGGVLTAAGTSSNPSTPFAIQKTGLSIVGANNRYVRMRIRRTAGFTWKGIVQYTTAGHGLSESFYAVKPVGMKVGGAYQEVVFDMHSLRSGANDWKNSTITGIAILLGTGKADSFEVDWVSISNESTSVATQPKYTINAVFTTSDNRETVLNDLAAAGAGTVHHGGEWIVCAGAWSSPVMTLDDSDKIGELQIIQSDAGLDELFNGVRATYFEAGSSVAKEADPYTVGVLVAEDGGELWQDLTFPYTDNEQRVQNLMRIAVERVRSGQIIRYPASLRAFPVRIGDRVAVTNAEYGFVAKTYLVTDWNFGQTSPVVLTLQEDAAVIWDLANQVVYDQTPNTLLNDPKFVLPFSETAIVVESGTRHLLKESDGSLTVRIFVQWPVLSAAHMEGDGARVEIIWQRVLRDEPNTWRRIDFPANQGFGYLLGAASTDTIIIGIRPRNSLGFTSEYVYTTHVVVGTSQPASDATGFLGTPFAGFILYTWDPCPDLDYFETEIRIGASWAAGTRVFKGNADRFPYQQNVPANVTAWIKHYDSSGNPSTNAISYSASSLSLNDTRNYDFSNGLVGWTAVSSIGASSSASGGNFGIATSTSIIHPVQTPIDITRRYRVTVRVYASGASISGLYAGVLCYDQSGAEIHNALGVDSPWCAGSSITVPNDSQWHVYSGEITSAFTIPNASAPLNKFWEGTVKAAPAIFVPAGMGAANLFIDYAVIDDITDVAILGAETVVPGANCQVSSGRISKIAGGNAWNAGATSRGAYKGGAFASVEITQGMFATGPVFMFGLNDNPTTDNYTDINFAFYIGVSSGIVDIYEEGVQVVASTTTFVDGDVFAITFDGTRARYYKNGVELKSTLASSTNAFYFDCSIWREGSYIDKIQFGPMSSNTWSDVGGSSKPSDYASADLTLVNQANCVQSGNRLTKVADINGWNAGAYTRNAYTGGAYISVYMTPGMSAMLPVFMFGLNDNPTTASYSDVNFAFAIGVNGASQVDAYEEGSLTATALTTFADGDHFEITYDGFTARWYKNGSLLRSVIVSNANSFYGDLSIWRTNTYIDRISFGPMSRVAGITDTQIVDMSADKLNAGSIRGINIQGSAHVTRGTYTTSALSGGETTINVKDSTDFASSGTAHIIDSTNDRDAFTYTGKTATSLTGCSGVLAHTQGASVIPFNSGDKCIAIFDKTNEIRLYGNRGDGVVEELASFGISQVGADFITLFMGSDNNSNIQINATSSSDSIVGVSKGVGGSGVVGFGDGSGGAGVFGAATGTAQQGVWGTAQAGFGGRFEGSSAYGDLRLSPRAGRPSDRTNGAVAIIYTSGGTTDARTGSPRLMIADGTNWINMESGAVWGG